MLLDLASVNLNRIVTDFDRTHSFSSVASVPSKRRFYLGAMHILSFNSPYALTERSGTSRKVLTD